MNQHTCSQEAWKNRLTGTKAQIKVERENGFVTDLTSECLEMSYCREWEIIIIKGVFGEDRCINDSEYGRRIC